MLLVRVIKGKTYVDEDARRLRKILENVIGEGVIRFEFEDLFLQRRTENGSSSYLMYSYFS